MNNLELLKPFLDFSDPDSFYYLLILKRKKDQEVPENHQSVRIIKTYSISSMEYLNQKWSEIVQLSELFKARVYINVNPTSHRKVTLQMMKDLASRVFDEHWDTSRLYDYSIGKAVSNGDIWVVDLDTKDVNNLAGVKNSIYSCRPAGDKILAVIPTPQGYHLLTRRFDVQEFNKVYLEADIKKANPTILYYPDSLESSK